MIEHHEQLVAGRSSGLCGWVHPASCSRSPFSSVADRASFRFHDRHRTHRYLRSIISRVDDLPDSDRVTDL